MKRKIRIQRVSAWNIGITIVVAVLFACIAAMGRKEFHILQTSTEQYISCEKAAKELQDGSDYLTEQVRLFAMTGQSEYMELYFKEADLTKRREEALQILDEYFSRTEIMDDLENALEYSRGLMDTEYRSMRLMAEATHLAESTWPEEIQETILSEEDNALSDEEKIERARKIVSDNVYQEVRTQISDNVSACMNGLISKTRSNQGRASTVFSDMYRKLEIGVAILAILMLLMCIVIRHLVVKPLVSYNESIKRGEIFPVIGAEELQNLALTYNKVYKENEETQKLIRHEAEHDGLTDLLNRGSFDKVLDIYEKGDRPFAMILVDVDIFKSVNDTYGHSTGDEILKKVATQLKTAFRSIDYVCRIGGDEFAVIMVEMTSDLKYTIEDKIDSVNKILNNPDDGLPAVSLSVGVAFSDRENPGPSIFNDADKALYLVKENGRNGYGFY